jgi:hypothetical protein
MKDNPEFEPMRNARNSRAQSTPKSTSRRQLPATARLALQKVAPVPTNRGLLICLGWLRLFKEIVAPNYAMVGRKGLRHAR